MGVEDAMIVSLAARARESEVIATIVWMKS